MIFHGRVEVQTLPTPIQTYIKVASQNHSLRQFWGASIPLSAFFASIGSSSHQKTPCRMYYVHSPKVCDVLI